MIVGDILDAEKVKKATRGCNYAYNYAGIADLDDATTKSLDTVRLNVIGNLHIMDAALKARCRRFIYASSIYVYSEKGGFYRCSKQAAELYIEEYQRRFGLEFTVLRYSTLYGPRADERNSIHRFLTQALTRGVIEDPGSGEEVRDYVHVRDAAQLSLEILGDPYRNKHIIASGHHPIKFKEMFLLVKEILGREIKVKYRGKGFSAHYNFTPYSFTPKIGHKLTNHLYLDIGQGLLECLNEIDTFSRASASLDSKKGRL